MIKTKKTVLLYNFSSSRLKLVRKALSAIGCSVRTVMKKEYAQPIGYLAGVENYSFTNKQLSEKGFDEEMLVMCGFGSEMIDVLISALKKSGVGSVPLKAVVTEHNINWDSVKLYNEIKAEQQIMSNIR